jgi:CRP-like cAMP-binding protein
MVVAVNPADKQKLKDTLEQVCSITDEAWIDVEQLLSYKTFVANEYLYTEGEKPKTAAFLLSGVVRAFYRDSDGEEYNKTFFIEGNFPSPLAALTMRQENYINLQALTPGDAIIINFYEFQNLFAKHRCLETFFRKIIEKVWVDKELREIRMVMKDATANYLHFQQQFPMLENKIPQYHIASYLGITPIQLSRIRAKLAKKQFLT